MRSAVFANTDGGSATWRKRCGPLLINKKPFALDARYRSKGLVGLKNFYLVPETDVLWRPMIFPITPKTEVQSAEVE